MTWAVFDTNAYRDLGDAARARSVPVSDAVAELRRDEAGAGVGARGHMTVAQELLANLGAAGASPRTRQSCVDAVVALCRHTSTAGAPAEPPHMLADVDAQLCLFLYGAVPPQLAAEQEQVQRLVYRIGGDPAGPGGALADPDVRTALGHVAAWVAATERAFVGDVVAFVLDQDPAGPVDWHAAQTNPAAGARAAAILAVPAGPPAACSAFAFGMAHRVAQLAGAPVVGPRAFAALRANAARIDALFPAAAALYAAVVRRLLTTGADLTKRSRENWVWDLMVACAATREQLHGRPLVLVTSDGMVADACRAAGLADAVRSYADYRANLASGRV